MILQKQMIESVRKLSQQHEKISAVLMYGSFIKDEGDQFSDIEFYIYYRGNEMPDKISFISQIASVSLFFTNEFGTDVAIFDNLIRGEFHFHPVSDMESIKTWQGVISFEYRDKMNLIDKDGTLTEILHSIPPVRPQRNIVENKESLAQNLINNLLFERNLILRKEYAHAHQQFWLIQRYILWLIRLHIEKDNHWESPTKKLEEDIPYEWYLKYLKCIPSIKAESLQESLLSALEISDLLFSKLNIPEHIHGVLRKINLT